MGFDRVVVDLSGSGRPGWLGEYVEDPVLQGSGAPLQLDGDATLRLAVTGVVYPTEEGAEPYAGPQRIGADAGEAVEEVLYGSILEGQAEVFVGIGSEWPFRVFGLEDPTRVVIDVVHP